MHAVSTAPHTSALYLQSAQTQGKLAQAQFVSLRTICTLVITVTAGVKTMLRDPGNLNENIFGTRQFL